MEKAKKFNDVSFEQMNLRKELLRGICSLGFKQPTPIQQRSIILASGGRHIVAQSQPGTGKTTALCIATLQQIDLESSHVQAIILSTTQDQAYQMEDALKKLGKFMGVIACACVGGTSFWQDRCNLSRAQIVVGTHGRILSLLRRRILDPSCVKCFVLDEADGLLAKDPSQYTDMQEITRQLRPSTQIMFFSADLPSEVEEAVTSMLRDPARISVEKDPRIFEGVHQYYLDAKEDEEKSKVLSQPLNQTDKQVIIYCNGREMVESLEIDLRRKCFKVSMMHTGMDREERILSVNDFRREDTKILITTNIIGRGLNLHPVSLVVNYDMPPTLVDYVHRLSHLGPLGKRSGVMISLVATEDDVKGIRQLENSYDTIIEKLPENIENILV